MKRKWAITLGISLSLLVGCAQTEEQPQAEPEQETAVSDPEQIYQNSCASCHGVDLQGGYGPGLQKVGSEYSEEEILKVIREGKGSMPSQSHISQDNQEKLAAWLFEKK